MLAIAALGLSLLTPKPALYEDQVFYQIFPRSYRDSNGDGIGDFKGIELGLPTIEKLGCTAILINPIQKARVYHNYFADDWMDVDPAFGTLADFDHLVAAAHARKIKIVLDMEPQYVASGHPWYQAAAKDPNGPAGDFLAKPFKPDPYAPSPWYNGAKVQMASVNLNNPHVIEEIGKVFRFWSARGVDGYRIDHMMDDLDWAGKSTGLYAHLWTPIEQDIKSRYPGSFFVGEQADWEAIRSPVDMFNSTPTDACFNFRLRNAILSFKKGFLSKNLEEYRYFTTDGRMQLSFLENHDMTRFASEEADPRRQRLAAALMMLVKGAPILYYGQEIGMKGEQGHFGSDGNDIPVRLAYRWGSKLDAPGTPLWYKDSGPWWNTRYSKDNDGASLQEQDNRSDSLFNWYRKLIEIRKISEALKLGSQDLMDVPSESVLAFRRHTDTETVDIYVNLSEASTVVSPAKPGEDLLTGTKMVAGRLAHLKSWQLVAIREDR